MLRKAAKMHEAECPQIRQPIACVVPQA